MASKGKGKGKGKGRGKGSGRGRARARAKWLADYRAVVKKQAGVVQKYNQGYRLFARTVYILYNDNRRAEANTCIQ